MKKRISTCVVAALGIFVLAGAGNDAGERQFRIRNDGGSRVQFVSDAPLETMTGVSSVVEGQFRADPADLSNARGRVEVKTASIKTGIDLRDKHLQSDNWLDANRHPTLVFELARITGTKSVRANRSHQVQLHGKLTLHGVTRRISAQAELRWLPLTEEMKATPGIDGDVVVIKASFKIKLTDYGLSIPLPVQLKVSETVEVSVSLRGIEERK